MDAEDAGSTPAVGTIAGSPAKLVDRKLKATWSVEAEEDLRAMHMPRLTPAQVIARRRRGETVSHEDIDPFDGFVKDMADEIDRGILDDLAAANAGPTKGRRRRRT